MARVRLYLGDPDPPHTYRFFRPDGSVDEIQGLRLKAYVRFLGRVDVRTDEGKRAAFPVCVVDTGSFLTIVPEKIWRYFLSGVVTLLPFHPSMPPHDRRLTIAGGTFPYDLGELVIPLRDKEGGALDVTVVAKFTRDGGALGVPLTLGLRGGFLDHARLRADPDRSPRTAKTGCSKPRDRRAGLLAAPWSGHSVTGLAFRSRSDRTTPDLPATKWPSPAPRDRVSHRRFPEPRRSPDVPRVRTRPRARPRHGRRATARRAAGRRGPV